ncbi:hypothetical protein H0H93_004998 [Arthromyces matolae]|nr:hypothetical protein H0H93_004998 [Arthromyces matolae]
MSVQELEQRTRHALRLSSRWLSGHLSPRRTLYIDSTANIPVSDVRFLPGRLGEWVLTVSKGIWDVLTIWDLSSSGTESRKACEWSLRGGLFNGLALNSSSGSEATVALAVSKDGEHKVHLLSLQTKEAGNYCLETISTVLSGMKPTKLEGDLLALSDDVTQTVIFNWRLRTSAILQQPEDDAGIWHPNRSIQVVFAHRSVLVVRACSIHLFPYPVLEEIPPTYHSIAQHSFGWIDGVCVTPSRSNSPILSILLRGESDDPWSSGLHSLDQYTLTPNPISNDENDEEGSFIPPYIFPPTLTAKVPAIRGSLRCRNVLLGPCGTAAWIQPQDRAVVGLAWPGNEDHPLLAIHPTSGNESLMVAAFPGPLARDKDDDVEQDGDVVGTRSTAVATNGLNNWTALDYDEEVGRIIHRQYSWKDDYGRSNSESLEGDGSSMCVREQVDAMWSEIACATHGRTLGTQVKVAPSNEFTGPGTSCVTFSFRCLR